MEDRLLLDYKTFIFIFVEKLCRNNKQHKPYFSSQ